VRSSASCCPQADGEGAVALLERLLEVTPQGQTFSAGVAVWDGVESPERLVGRADEALYLAKHAGRNRVRLAQGSPEPARP
jgi:PleD family two-component response regulator